MLNRDTESKGRDSSEKNLAGVKNKIGTEERDKKNRRILDSSIIANQRVISKGIVSRYATVTVQRDGSYATVREDGRMKMILETLVEVTDVERRRQARDGEISQMF